MRILLLIIIFFLGLNPTWADSVNIASVHNFVEQNSAKVIATLQSDDNDQQKTAHLEEIFISLMDIDWMGKFVLGKFWKELNEEHKISYLIAYKKYLVASYIPLFKKYQRQNLVIKNVKVLDGDQFSVLTEIADDSQKAPYNVEYKIKYLTGAYKVRDIIAEGVSLLATQRSDFSSIVSNGGIESLLTKLAEKSHGQNY